jgi:cleavage and polyadenylation specificity factor subunit 2
MAALRRDGNVLLPVDASGRVLELLLVLDRHWDRHRLSDAYNLCWVGPMCPNVIEYARAQLEWMAAPLGAQFDSQRGHPFALKCVSMFTSVSEMTMSIGDADTANPTCVLASGATLDAGPARDLLLRWGGDPDNLVLLTDSTRCVPRGDVRSRMRRRRGSAATAGRGGAAADRDAPTLLRLSSGDAGAVSGGADDGGAAVDAAADDDGGNNDAGGGQAAKFVGPALAPESVSPYSTSSQLLYRWCAAKASNEEMPDEVVVDAYVPHRAPLRGRELLEFLAEEEREVRSRKAEMEERAMMREIELARGRLRLGVGDGDEGGAVAGGATGAGGGGIAPSSGQMTAMATTTAGGVSSSSRPKKKSRFDQALFIKFSKPVHSEFSFFVAAHC